jgi:hypothetical protein
MIDELYRKLDIAESNAKNLQDDETLLKLWQEQVEVIKKQIEFLNNSKNKI